MFIMKYLKSMMYILISILLFSVLIGTLNYFNLFTTKISNIFEIIAMIISMFIGGLYLGKNSNKRGYLEGLKIGLFMIIVLFLFSYLAFGNFKLFYFIYYAIILISSVLGSVLGINKRSAKA